MKRPLLTLCHGLAPAYVNSRNVGKTIDYTIVPCDLLQAVSRCETCAKTTRQVSSSLHVVDHVCLVTTLFVPRRSAADTRSSASGTATRWLSRCSRARRESR